MNEKFTPPSLGQMFEAVERAKTGHLPPDAVKVSDATIESLPTPESERTCPFCGEPFGHASVSLEDADWWTAVEFPTIDHRRSRA